MVMGLPPGPHEVELERESANHQALDSPMVTVVVTEKAVAEKRGGLGGGIMGLNAFLLVAIARVGAKRPSYPAARVEFVKQVLPEADLCYVDGHFVLDEYADKIAAAIIQTFSDRTLIMKRTTQRNWSSPLRRLK
jgi:hypothetical protein